MRQDLHPMYVNPLVFAIGDTVKKVISGDTASIHVGVVTAVIPSTNKVQVQWPDSFTYEEPVDLIKVNPVLYPPIVNNDKSYKSFQNQLGEYYRQEPNSNINDLKNYKVIENFYKSYYLPLFNSAISLYLKGYSKKQAFAKLATTQESKHIAKDTINRIFNDTMNANFYKSLTPKSNVGLDKNIDVKISLTGNSDDGFILITDINNEKSETKIDNVFQATELYNRYTDIAHNIAEEPNSCATLNDQKLKDLDKAIEDTLLQLKNIAKES